MSFISVLKQEVTQAPGDKLSDLIAHFRVRTNFCANLLDYPCLSAVRGELASVSSN